MKSYLFALASTFLMALFLCSCDNDIDLIGNKVVYNKDYKGIELTKAERKVAARDLDFGVSLFTSIVNSAGVENDVLISPLSTSMAFAMLSAGAEGQTRNEIVNGLGFSGLDYAYVASYYKKVSDDILSTSPNKTVSIANAIWSGVPLKQQYVEETKKMYNSEVRNISFSDPKTAAGIINGWTSQKTNGQIPSILTEDMISFASMVLENVLYFKSSWQLGSYERVEKPFTDYKNNISKRDYFTSVSGRESLSYFDDEVAVLKIPYEGGAFNMMVVLPQKEKDIERFVSSLSSQKWDSWSSSCSVNKVVYSIPCFDYKNELGNLYKEAIENRGIKIPFTPMADFSNMAETDLFITFLAHNASISVSEKGTEASSATAAGASLIAPDPGLTKDYYVFEANRPFVYAIEEASTGILLFIGTHVK